METDEQILDRLDPQTIPDATYQKVFSRIEKRKAMIQGVLEQEQLEDIMDDDSEDPHSLSSLPEDFDYSQDKGELTTY